MLIIESGEKIMKLLHRTVIIIASISLILFLFYLSIMPIAMTKSFYLNQYRHYHADEVTGYSMEQLSDITDTMLDYLKGKRDSMQVIIDGQEVFSEQAIDHMADVRVLFIGGRKAAWIDFGVLLLAVAYIIYFFKDLNQMLLKTFLASAGAFMIIVIAAGIFAAIDFDTAFTLIHHVFFPNNNDFNNAFFMPDDFLINMLQEELFFNISFIIIATFISLLLLTLAGLVILQKKVINSRKATDDH
jgi:integral membrane protein (TIGR01906 family)